MSLPKEPRQLMINLMYLVLTALLAMNVSKEVINAFTIVDKSIERSNNNIDNKNDATMVNFSDAQQSDEIAEKKREKIAEAMEIAKKAREKTSAMVEKLKAYRQTIVERAGNMVEEEGKMKIKREADLEAATSLMITEGKGGEMKDQLSRYKTEMADFINTLDSNMRLSRDTKSFEEKLPINFDIDDKNKSWSKNMFEMVPAVAAVTIVDKYINDVKNSESIVLDELWASAMGERKQQKIVLEEDFDKFGIIANLDNSYALPGQRINLTTMLGAYNSDSRSVRIWVNGQQVNPKNGVAERAITASTTPGPHKIKIRAQYLDRGTNEDENNVWSAPIENEVSYFVGQPAASIALDEMNILYKGLDNPLTVAASGVPLGKITVKAGPNLTVKRVGLGKYTASPAKNSGNSWIEVYGEQSDGTVKKFGRYPYRLGRVPPPLPYVNNKQGGSMPSKVFSVQQAVFAKLVGFPYRKLKFTVTQFDFFYISKRRGASRPITVRSQFLNHPRGNKEVIAIMKNIVPGDRVFIENIRAVGPDPKDVRKLGDLSFTFPN